MWSDDRIQDIVEQALAAAMGDEADVSVYRADRGISRFAGSNLRQNMVEATGNVTIRVFVDRRAGVAATSSLEPDEIRRAAALALDLARANEPSEDFAGLPLSDQPLPSIQSHDAALAALTPEAKGEQLRRAFARGREQQIEFAGTYTTTDGCLATGNSRGARRLAHFTTADALFIALRERRSGFATQIARHLHQLDVEALAAEAIEKCTLGDGNDGELPPGRYDVILEPAAFSEVFEWMSMITFNGRSFDDGSSFLRDHLGERVVGENVTIADDATDPDFMPFPFDLESLPKRRIDLIENGIARTPLVDSLFARRLQLPMTSSCSDLGSEDHGMPLHLSMKAGTTPHSDLIANSERAIWVTRFHYLNGLLEPKVARMTGMTRDGTFLVENGRVTKRLVNLRWTMAMVEALQNITALSRERRAIGTWWNPIGGTLVPTIKVANWEFTGAQKKSNDLSS